MTPRSLAPMFMATALMLGGTAPGHAQAATSTASSGPHDSNAPIDWDANRIEVQDKQHRAILTGSVRVRQEEMTLTSDRVTANYTGSIAGGDSGGAAKGAGGGGPQVHRLDATGNVVVTRPGEIARGQYGIYDLDKRLVTLIGGVSLDRNGSITRGGRLVIDLNSGHANMDGGAVGGNGTSGGGGRVSGRFTVAQHNDTAPKPATK